RFHTDEATCVVRTPRAIVPTPTQRYGLAPDRQCNWRVRANVWRFRANIWRKPISPARGPKRLISGEAISAAQHNFVRGCRRRKPVPGLPNPNPVRPSPGPEELRRYYRSAKIAGMAAIVAFAVVWGLGSSPWPVTATLRHIASAPNCGFSACAQTLTG